MQTCTKLKAESVAYNLIAAFGQVELKSKDALRYMIKDGHWHLCWVMKYINFGFSR